MINSLRRALQPAVTDLSIKFDMPSSFEVYQAPEEIPTLFSGDKIVVYGIMKQQKKSTSDQSFRASVNGTATLTGQILRKPIQFKLTFEIPPPSDFQSSVEMPIVHQLASKAFIHDLQSREDWTAATMYKQQKKGIVDLSIESGVVSAHTAYIALDEEQDKLIEGAVKTWDVVATMTQYRKSMSHRIPPRNLHFGGAYSMFAPGLAPSTASRRRQPPSARGRQLSSAQRLYPRPRRLSATSDSDHLSANSMYNIDDMYFRQENACNQSKGEWLPPDRKGDSTGRTSLGVSLYSGFHLEQDDEMRYSRFTGSSVRLPPEGPVACHFVPPMSLARKREQSAANQVARPRDNLEFLIFLQKFEGFWDFDMLQWLDLPVLLKTDNIKICATVYALAYMEIKFPSQCDEWELVARKAEAWLECQTLPDQVNLEELKKEASDYIINNLVE